MKEHTKVKLYGKQQDALLEMKKQNTEGFLYKYTDYKFGFVNDIQEFIEILLEFDGKKHFYEVLQPKQPVALWCDIDALWSDLTQETPEEVYMLFQNLMKDVFLECGLNYNPRSEYILLARTKEDGKKLSIHWSYDDVIFPCNTEQLKFWKYVELKIKSTAKYIPLTFTTNRNNKPRITTIIDTGVYTKNRAVRTIYSTKEGQDRTLLPVRLHNDGKFKIISQPPSIEKYLITRTKTENFTKINIQQGDESQSSDEYKESSIEKIILDNIPNVSLVEIKGGMVKLKNKGNRTCVIGGEVNKSDNCYCIIFPDRIDFYCHDEECKLMGGKTIHTFPMFPNLVQLGDVKSEIEMYLLFKNCALSCKTTTSANALIDVMVDYFNKHHIMIKQAKTYILREKYIMDDDGLPVLEIMPTDDSYMKINYSNMVISFPTECEIGANSLYGFWKHSINRRSASKVVFYPKAYYADKQNPDVYNMFRGLAIERTMLDGIQGFTDKEIEEEEYFKHIKYRWCDGNIDAYNKVLDFFASILQRPWYKMKFCIVLKSLERAGKGLPIQIFSELIGAQYFFHPSSSEEVLGSFNANMMNKLVCFIDEMVWGGDKEKSGVIKKLTTEDYLTLKQKYMPDQIIKNCINLIMASNEDWVVPAGTTDTRWLVLNVSNDISQMKDKQKKKKIITAIRSIDRMKLAKFFYERDLSNFDDRETIKTDGLREQQIQSLNKLNKWWLDCLNSGTFEYNGVSNPFNQFHNKKDIYASYVAHSNDKHTSATKFWRDLKTRCDYTVYGNGRSKCNLNTLDQARQKWRVVYDDPNWTFDEYYDGDGYESD